MKHTRRTKIRLYIVICVIILAFLVFDKMREKRRYGENGIAEASVTTMPQWTLRDLDGNKINSKLFKGDVVLITFWSIDCDACLEEVSVFKDLQTKYGEKGFKILAVSLDARDDVDVKGFARGENINYIVLKGNATMVKKFAHVKEVPESFLFNRAGDLIYYTLGKIDLDKVNSLIESSL